jgi:hypothetical protein
MKSPSPPVPGPDPTHRVRELLADRAVFGLDLDDEAELAGLMADSPDTDHEGLDRIAAALAVAWSDRRRAGLPSPAAAGMRRGRSLALVAVAAVIGAVACWPLISSRPQAVDGPRLPADPVALAREQMLTDLDDVIRLECSAIARAEEIETGEKRPRGDIVWSPSRQRGFLRINGLPPNDPRERQYQIWIIVGRRAVPVRGGVFNVRSPAENVDDGSGIVVPILPQEVVQGPMTFAITAENPGGGGEYSADRVQAVARID